MNPNKNRQQLLALWAAFFLFHVGILFYLFFTVPWEMEDLVTGVKALSAAYSPYLGSILMFYWGAQQGTLPSTPNRTPFMAAVVSSIIWNLIITGMLLPMLWGGTYLEDALEAINSLISVLSWLVAGAIGFFFAKET